MNGECEPMKALERIIKDDWLGVHFAVNVSWRRPALANPPPRRRPQSDLGHQFHDAASDPVIKQAAKTFRGRIPMPSSAVPSA